jgi:hypothetical protein
LLDRTLHSRRKASAYGPDYNGSVRLEKHSWLANVPSGLGHGGVVDIVANVLDIPARVADAVEKVLTRSSMIE